jgi:DNA-binding MarR family transcriptional regulator
LTVPLSFGIDRRTVTLRRRVQRRRSIGSMNNLGLVIRRVRTCFRLLGTVSDQMLAELGLTASLRAVLEHLSEVGEQTVPQIAREKFVRRQSIQALVDQLIELELVRLRENPSHRRSALVSLTRKGAATFNAIREREMALLNSLQRRFNSADLAVSTRALAALSEALREVAQRTEEDDD